MIRLCKKKIMKVTLIYAYYASDTENAFLIPHSSYGKICKRGRKYGALILYDHSLSCLQYGALVVLDNFKTQFVVWKTVLFVK